MNLLTRKALYFAWQLKMHIKEFYRWHHLNSCNPDPNIRVFYGFEHLPTIHQKASGGIIKCQDLSRLFPNETRHPNMLYLVSSALPPHLEPLIHYVKKAGAPIILNQNGVAYPAWHGPGWESTNRPLALAHSAADYVFYQSQFCLDSAIRFLGTHCGSEEILYNAVDTKRFFPLSSKPKRLKPILLVAGDHLFSYRVLSAINVLALLYRDMPSITLLIAGNFRWRKCEKEALKETRDLSKRLGVQDRIEGIGPYTQEESPLLMRRADILIHPQYNDSCPRLVIEAMASGLPVVYSASGGVPELVGENAGVGIPAPFDWEKTHIPCDEEMADGVLEILKSYTNISECARKRAGDRFDVARWLKRHAEVLTEFQRKTRFVYAS